MSPLPGDRPSRPTSLTSPTIQLSLAAALLLVAVGAYFYAPHARATDQWYWNGLSAVCALAGVLFLPFALTSWGKVLRNRRSPG